MAGAAAANGEETSTAVQIEFHSCGLRFFSFSPCRAFPLCLRDWTDKCTDGALASKMFA